MQTLKRNVFFYLFCIFLLSEVRANEECGKSLISAGFSKYKNKFSKSFEIYNHERNNQTIWRIDDNWYGRGYFPDKLSCSLTKIPKLKRAILMSSTLLEAFVEIGVEKSIVGVGERKYIYKSEDKLDNAIDLGTVPSLEKVLSLKPDVFFGYKSPTLNVFYQN